MIRVEVKEYCNDCLDFNPDVTKPKRIYIDDQETHFIGDTIIRCEYRKRCESIRRFLKQQMKTEEQE